MFNTRLAPPPSPPASPHHHPPFHRLGKEPKPFSLRVLHISIKNPPKIQNNLHAQMPRQFPFKLLHLFLRQTILKKNSLNVAK